MQFISKLKNKKRGVNSVKCQSGSAERVHSLPDLGKEGLLVAVLDAFQVRQRHILKIRLGKKKNTSISSSVPPYRSHYLNILCGDIFWAPSAAANLLGASD